MCNNRTKLRKRKKSGMTQARADEIKEDYLKVSGSVQWEGRKEGEGGWK
jgi:hypothetical protein